MINQNDARNFVMALNGITGFVPPVMMMQLTQSPVAMALQNVANGQIELTAKMSNNSGEAGPPAKPHLVGDSG